MKLQYESKYIKLRNNYLFVNNYYTHMKWVRFNISSLSKGEKKKLSMGLINKSITTKLWTAPCLVTAKYVHP